MFLFDKWKEFWRNKNFKRFFNFLVFVKNCDAFLVLDNI